MTDSRYVTEKRQKTRCSMEASRGSRSLVRSAQPHILHDYNNRIQNGQSGHLEPHKALFVQYSNSLSPLTRCSYHDIQNESVQYKTNHQHFPHQLSVHQDFLCLRYATSFQIHSCVIGILTSRYPVSNTCRDNTYELSQSRSTISHSSQDQKQGTKSREL